MPTPCYRATSPSLVSSCWRAHWLSDAEKCPSSDTSCSVLIYHEAPMSFLRSSSSSSSSAYSVAQLCSCVVHWSVVGKSTASIATCPPGAVLGKSLWGPGIHHLLSRVGTSILTRDIAKGILSVRPLVCHTPVLYRNGLTYHTLLAYQSVLFQFQFYFISSLHMIICNTSCPSTKHFCEIPTESPPTRALNTGGVYRFSTNIRLYVGNDTR